MRMMRNHIFWRNELSVRVDTSASMFSHMAVLFLYMYVVWLCRYCGYECSLIFFSITEYVLFIVHPNDASMLCQHTELGLKSFPWQLTRCAMCICNMHMGLQNDMHRPKRTEQYLDMYIRTFLIPFEMCVLSKSVVTNYSRKHNSLYFWCRIKAYLLIAHNTRHMFVNPASFYFSTVVAFTRGAVC